MQMFVRFIGTKICYTLDDGRFFMADVVEATSEELQIAQAGGGNLPASEAAMLLAS